MGRQRERGSQRSAVARFFAGASAGGIVLAVAAKAGAKAIVSTRRGNYKTIPRSDLLAEIGKRVSNTKSYAVAFKKAGVDTREVPKFGEFEKDSFAAPQPLRTDLERILGSDTGFVDVEIEA